MAKTKYILGIDVGGTNIKYGLVTKQGKLHKLEQVATPKTKKAVINLLIKLIKEKRDKISGVGLGLPCPIDQKLGKTLDARNLSCLSNLPIVKLLKQRVKLPIKIDNDVNCFTLAEALIGSAKNYKNVIGIALGTGLGGGIVINKKIYWGRSNAGGVGRQIIDFKNSRDSESFLGARELKLKAKDYIKLEKQARQKNKQALNFWNNLGVALGFTCLNLINVLDPDIIVLGGKQSKAFKYFKPSMDKTIKKYYYYKPTKIVKSKLIDKAGVIGAALMFK